MGISKVWGKAVVVAGCLGVMASAAHAGYDENVGAATDSSSSNMGGMGGSMSGMSRSDMRMRNAQMLIQTLSEEKTEIGALAAQREMFLRMGGTENRRIARLWLRWINEHKAGGPTFMRLIRLNGGDPMEAHVLKAPPLGSRAFMLMATHKDHVAAVMTSQMRFNMTMSPSVKAAMHKRANLARKHLRQMTPFHRDMMMKVNGGMNNGGMSNGMNSNMGGMDNSSMDNSADSSTTTTTTTNTTTNSTSVGTPDTSATDNSTDSSMDNSTTSSTDTTTSSDAAGTVENSTSSGDSNAGGLATGTNDGGNGSTNNSGADTGGLTTGTNDGTNGTTTDDSGADVGGLQSGTNNSGSGTMNGQ